MDSWTAILGIFGLLGGVFGVLALVYRPPFRMLTLIAHWIGGEAE